MYDFVMFLANSLYGLVSWLDTIVIFDTISLLRIIFIIMLFKLVYLFVGWVCRVR